MKLLIVIMIALAGCGAASPTAATTPDVSRFSDKEFASEDLCEAAVSNFEKEQFLSTTTPTFKKGLFNRTEFDRIHRFRVQTCTAKLTERQAACIAMSASLQYIRNCERFPELQ